MKFFIRSTHETQSGLNRLLLCGERDRQTCALGKIALSENHSTGRFEAVFRVHKWLRDARFEVFSSSLLSPCGQLHVSFVLQTPQLHSNQYYQHQHPHWLAGWAGRQEDGLGGNIEIILLIRQYVVSWQQYTGPTSTICTCRYIIVVLSQLLKRNSIGPTRKWSWP